MNSEIEPSKRAVVHVDDTDENFLSLAFYDAGLSEFSPTVIQDDESVERVWGKILQTITTESNLDSQSVKKE